MIFFALASPPLVMTLSLSLTPYCSQSEGFDLGGVDTAGVVPASTEPMTAASRVIMVPVAGHIQRLYWPVGGRLRSRPTRAGKVRAPALRRRAQRSHRRVFRRPRRTVAAPAGSRGRDGPPTRLPKSTATPLLTDGPSSDARRGGVCRGAK